MKLFNKENKSEANKPVGLKPISYPAHIVLIWTKAINGDRVNQLWLKENGYEELFHATNAIYLIEKSRNWLMENGYAHLMAMINGAEGIEKAQEWLKIYKMDLLYHMGRAVDHNEESWHWLGKNVSPDLFMLTKSIQFIKDQIEENHNDIHSFGKDI